MRRLLLCAALTASTTAYADPPVAGTGSDATTPTSDTPTIGKPDDEPSIAKPAPDAPPDKVEEAKQVAKSAELTPILPSPTNPTRPAFQLYAEIDPPVLTVGLVYMLARRVRQQPAFCAPNCESVELNWLDRKTAGFYSAGWSTASDIELGVIGAATAGLLISDEGVLATLNDSVVIAEATLSASALATVMTLAAGRPRPFLYSDKAPLELRNSSDASLSFLSSHTADAFAIVTATYMAERRLHPTTNRSRWYLAGGLAAASLVGVSRVMAGYHFITDAIGGAAVGISAGFIVTSVHKSPVHIVPVVNRDTVGKVSGGGVGVEVSI